MLKCLKMALMGLPGHSGIGRDSSMCYCSLYWHVMDGVLMAHTVIADKIADNRQKRAISLMLCIALFSMY